MAANRDTGRMMASLNGFAYCGNSPVVNIDATGYASYKNKVSSIGKDKVMIF